MKIVRPIFSILLFSCFAIMQADAQNARTVLEKANQEFVIYEHSASDKSSESYGHLYQAYSLFTQALDISDNEEIVESATARLVQIYPMAKNAAMYYSNTGDTRNAYLFGMAYIRIPQHSKMYSAKLTRDELYPQIVYNTGISAYKLQILDDAVLCFNEYLKTGTMDRAKDCFILLNGIYMEQKNYEAQEKIMTKAVEKFPNSLDFYYNLINIYISTKDNASLMKTIDRVLAIDPNDINVLPIKARMEEAAGNLHIALDTYKKLIAFNPDDMALLKGVAKCNFKIGSDLNNMAFSVVDEADGMKIKQEAYPYLYDAKVYFEKILGREPDSPIYMKALEECYKFLGMNDEAIVMLQLIADKKTYAEFPRKLQEQKMAARNEMPDLAESRPSAILSGEPPVLTTTITSIKETNSNNVLDAGESFSISFTVKNSGAGDASDVKVLLGENAGLDRYFEGAKEIEAGLIKAGESRNYTFRFTMNEDAPTAKATITLYTLEGNGMDADPSNLVVNIQEMSRPLLRVVDYQYLSDKGTSITLGDKGKLIVAVQNVGREAARNTKVSFELPNNIIATADLSFSVAQINPGDVVPVTLDFLVNKRFALDSIPIGVKVYEPETMALLQDVYKVKLGEYLSTANRTIIEGKLDDVPKLDSYTLAMESELLDNVPAGESNPNRFALIIGNENYSVVGGNAEINVPFACNDAIVFKEYCIRTFGISDEQIRYIDNATAGIMRESLDWLVNIGNANPNAELFFFYSGHGSNDEATREPYLLPVDVTGKYIKLGISLNQLYAQLSNTACKASYVFLDACFSGGYKSKDPLLTQKGVRVTPKFDSFDSGKLICFSSSTGEQTSSVYFEKHHGYFTYYLLKSIQDASGEITLSELYEKTRNSVENATAISGKIQSPQVIVSGDWNQWGSVRLKE